jgi:hypothetical protein
LREPILHAKRAKNRKRCGQSPRCLLARPNGTRETTQPRPSPPLSLRRAAKTKFAFSFLIQKPGGGKKEKMQRQILIFAGSLQSFQNAIALFLLYLFFNDAFFHSFSELALPPERLVVNRSSARSRETPHIGLARKLAKCLLGALVARLSASYRLLW